MLGSWMCVYVSNQTSLYESCMCFSYNCAVLNVRSQTVHFFFDLFWKEKKLIVVFDW
jgi:hypothetical protein